MSAFNLIRHSQFLLLSKTQLAFPYSKVVYFFTIDVDDFIGTFRIGFRGIESKYPERAFFIIPEDGFLHDLMGMDVGQAGAFKFIKVISVVAFNFPEVGAVAIGGDEDDAFDPVLLDE